MLKIITAITLLLSMFIQAPVTSLEAESVSDEKVVWLMLEGLSDELYEEMRVSDLDLPNFDRLENNGSRFTKVNIPRPGFAGASAAALTGRSPGENGAHIRYYDHEEEKYHHDYFQVKHPSVFNILIEESNLKIAGSGWRSGPNRITDEKVFEHALPEQGNRFNYKDYPSGDNNLVSMKMLAKDYKESLDQDMDIFVGYSNDLLIDGWSNGGNTEYLKRKMIEIDEALGDMIDASIENGSFENTTWFIHGGTDIYQGHRKIDVGTFVKTLSQESGLNVTELNKNTSPLRADIGIIKQYRVGFGQLYFNKNLDQETRTKVIELLNDSNTEVGGQLAKAAPASQFNMSESVGDLILWPKKGHTFSAASASVIRTDDFNNPYTFMMMSGNKAPRGKDIANEYRSLEDVLPNVLKVLGVRSSKTFDGKVWDYKEAELRVPKIVVTNLESQEFMTYEKILVLEGAINTKAEMKINGETIDLDESLSFFKEIELEEGENIITLTAENSKGIDTYTVKATYRHHPEKDGEEVVVYINWDGFAKHYLDLAIEQEREIDTLRQVLQEGVSYENAYTLVPSITNAMQPIIVSGVGPRHTDNHYRYFNKELRTAVQETPARINRAETIAEALNRQGYDLISINQFAFENMGAYENDPKHLYVSVPGGSGLERFDYATEFLETLSAEGHEFLDVPSFIALYMDEPDGLGHNEKIIHGMDVSETEEERVEKVLVGLEMLDKKLGEFIDKAKELDIYDRMSFILTTDHGMTPYGQQDHSGPKYQSSLPDLEKTIEGLGYKVETLLANQSLQNPDTDIAIVTVGLQAQISYVKENDDDKIDQMNQQILQAVQDKEYFGTSMDYHEFPERDVKRGFADLIISPKPPYNFKTGDPNRVRVARGQHDSLDETSQKVPLILWGNNVKRNKKINRKVYTPSVASTISVLLGAELPMDAYAEPLYDALEIEKEEYKFKEKDFSGKIAFDIDSIYHEIVYRSDRDQIFTLMVNEREIRDVFFPSTNGAEDIKRINLSLSEGDVIELVEKDREISKFEFKSIRIFSLLEDESEDIPSAPEPEETPGNTGEETNPGGEGTGSEGEGTGSEGEGTGSEGEGTGSEGEGTGSEDEGTGSEGEGTGSEGEGTGSEGTGTGLDNSSVDKDLEVQEVNDKLPTTGQSTLRYLLPTTAMLFGFILYMWDKKRN